VVSASGEQTVSPSLAATRTSGYAPLAVHFDATGAISAVPRISDPEQGGRFRQILHAFDFGDPGSGNHSLDGMSRNSEPLGGGLAAHVYDAPGSYVATVTSTDGIGAPASASVSITVLDPSTLETYAISKSGDFAGAPAGSIHLTQSAPPTFESDSRYFFRRGEDWSGSSIDIGDPLTNVHVDAYGSGAKPVFDVAYVGYWRPSTSNFADDIRICNIHVTKDGLRQQNGSRVLFYGCDSDFDCGAGTGYSPVDSYRVVPQERFENAHELFFVDCTLDGHGDREQYLFYGNGSRLVFLNTFMGGSKNGTARIVSWERGVMRHCRVESPYQNATVHALKLHSGGTNDYADNWLQSGGGKWMTRKNVIANNEFGGGPIGVNWTIGVCPSNSGFGGAGDEPIEDVIVEGNTFVHHDGWSCTDIVRTGRRITTRGNTVKDGGTAAIGKGHSQPPAYDGPYFED
jgi:hypothetical protein